MSLPDGLTPLAEDDPSHDLVRDIWARTLSRALQQGHRDRASRAGDRVPPFLFRIERQIFWTQTAPEVVDLGQLIRRCQGRVEAPVEERET